MNYYGASAVILTTDFVKSVANEEYNDLLDFLQNTCESDMDCIANGVAHDDMTELLNELGEHLDEFMVKLHTLQDKFKQETGLALYHLYITNDEDITDLVDGHHFALKFDDVYTVSDNANKIREHWKHKHWATFS